MKVVWLGTAAPSFVVAFFVQKYGDYLNLSLPDITQKYQVWRLLTSHFVFGSPTEMIFGLGLLYTFRQFERNSGSKKFAASLGFFAVTSSLFQLLLLYLLKIKAVSGGPYAFIFGLFVQFFADVPQSFVFRLLRLKLSDKIVIYLLGLQLMFSDFDKKDFPVSLIPTLCGIIGGFLWRYNCFGVNRIRFPEACTRFCQRFVSPFVTGSGSQRYERVETQSALYPGMASPTQSSAVGGVEPSAPGGEALMPSFFDASPAVVPNEDAVRSLTAMGFSEPAVRQALILSQNNVEIASGRLAEASSSG